MEPWLPWYALTGVLAGLLAGLMGVGGGLVIVPSLLLAFALQGVEPHHLAHLAVGTSLAAIVPISISSLWAHHRRGAVEWPLVLLLAPGLMLGAWSGAWLADQMSTLWLKRLFGGFLLLVALQMVTGFQPSRGAGRLSRISRQDPDFSRRDLRSNRASWAERSREKPESVDGDKEHLGENPCKSLLSGDKSCTSERPGEISGSSRGLWLLVGWLIGGVSGLVGIGGGTMTVPFLAWQGRPLPRAVATSAACGLPIALAGAAGFLYFGSEAALPGASGYLHWPAMAAISLSAVAMAPMGARLAHSLPVALLRRLFALVLGIVGLRLLFT